ncbi:hypothetical protein [Paraburkholderia sp.]|uniref:hypothetical protein n=1 Tax=Paraburkholderia sp. TaxID=1926495 RepID=UPI002389758D|nr:hypothetical protein [Paraburkholderia sp.]MDE1179814.1 hypothetical protein [Paraburkholderia sp.]
MKQMDWLTSFIAGLDPRRALRDGNGGAQLDGGATYDDEREVRDSADWRPTRLRVRKTRAHSRRAMPTRRATVVACPALPRTVR